nr:GNAT family N-acetyltransferase [Mangrovicoccus sp. HB161399]
MLSGTERGAAAALVWQAFSRKLGTALFPEPKALAVLAQAIRPDCALAAASPGGAILGVAGFRLPCGAGLVELGPEQLRPVYGRFGTLWRSWLLERFGREARDGELMLEALCVRSDLRGLGIGSRLIDGIETEARRRGLGAIRLEVDDRNPRARALYERRGYRAQEAVRAGPLAPVLGFRRATRLVHRL